MEEKEIMSDEKVGELLDQATALVEEGKFSEAEELLKQLEDSAPDNALVQYNLSVIYLIRLKKDLENYRMWEDYSDEEGLFEEAIAHCQTAIELDPNLVPAHNNLGTLYAIRGWNDKAIEQWEESLSLHPDQPDVREDLTALREDL